ncbi:phosphatidylinositol-specific phospholipase C1-like protein [Aquihabitans sp. G128]|uniref:phosphatidylinositol-specific phospholipase C1-like protein n=1 Tax=Aquihabitans sp. G128 TaxID=2849779 RepID=UPI001C24043C|nr:phosphatidylinositol-specific phospholipase C1-like protein [Aquihabitans sp. G128]QXC62847.1 phosphatidylinositol-specific phospholipase C1-like protein [Aquihabitans sp. G128]
MGNRAERRIGLLGAALVLAAALAACSSDGGSDAARTTTTKASAATSTTAPKADDDLRLDQIQAIGTHNSFHVAAPKAEHDLLVALNPGEAATRTYSHPALATQVGEERVRQLELDVFADSRGGLYATPKLREQAGLGPYVDEVPEMAEPGTKVLHEQDVDYHSACPSVVTCLTELKAWSDDHPDHVPVAVNIQFKDGPLIFNVPGQARPEKWTAAAMAVLDREIRSVLDPDDLITPEDVQGDHATLEAAVLDHAWPTLGESRGKFLFLMVNGEPYRSSYLKAFPDLSGAVLFTNADPGQPDASYVGIDDPVADGDEIADLVAKGYLVRTRADEPNEQGRTGDTTVRDAALASGAQWVSTDYPGPDGAKPSMGTDYTVELPGFRAARCNPVTAPKGCDDAAVEPAS